ncbi:hypothetical protein [Pseudomaricurvus sp.]|uniref:hypothetical protein n=1 Tax=Pseudomaricurvus sp. TaxID=2004510 RepID=UPI003F6CA77A
MMNVKSSLFALSICFALPLTSAQAETRSDAQQALNALSGSVASAELALSVAGANQAIREVQTQDAINQLSASVAQADLSIALANANETIKATDNGQMLNELDALLNGMDDHQVSELISAVVSERPGLAADVQTLALNAGFQEDMVASSIISGISDAPATAAGQ